MPTTECGAADHDLEGSSGGTSVHQTATMACRKCGVGQAVDIRYLGNRRVGVDLKIFPARGSTTVSRPMVRFFMLSYESTCQEIAGDGNVVVRGTPEIPPAEGL
jgi:hypothetical protein